MIITDIKCGEESDCLVIWQINGLIMPAIIFLCLVSSLMLIYGLVKLLTWIQFIAFSHGDL